MEEIEKIALTRELTLLVDAINFSGHTGIASKIQQAIDRINSLESCINEELQSVRKFWDIGEFSINTIDKRTRESIDRLTKAIE